MALRQAQDSFEHWMPNHDCPVTKLRVQRGNGQVLEQVSLTGAAAKFTSQTLSKVGTDSNPADYRVETQQMEMTQPGVDCTTKFRKVVYSGKGIDMDVMNEAKRYESKFLTLYFELNFSNQDFGDPPRRREEGSWRNGGGVQVAQSFGEKSG
jgi:hypothetical protein